MATVGAVTSAGTVTPKGASIVRRVETGTFSREYAWFHVEDDSDERSDDESAWLPLRARAFAGGDVGGDCT